jgi:hypothetical protein
LKRIVKITTLADRLLFLLLISASLAGIFYSREAVSKSSDVVIEVNGRPQYTFPLYSDRTVSVSGPYGNTVIEIKDRKVRVKEAHCPNQLCVKEGWISRGAIVCLPNRIVVLVGGGDHGKDIDAISG